MVVLIRFSSGVEQGFDSVAVEGRDHTQERRLKISKRPTISMA